MRSILPICFLAVILLTSAVLAQAQDTATPKPKVGVVSTAHLDTQWRWTIKNTIEEYIPNTLHDNFKLLDLYPDYVFSFEGAFRYQLMREYYPEDYARLKKYIADGRWRVTGAWVDACDVNIPSFESLTRHALYGNGFYKKEFGKQSYDIFMPDCFGFGYALPSIANHCGLKSFSTQKLTWGCSVPVPFSIGEWQGVDGSTVIAGLKTGNYVAKIKDDLSRDTTWLNMANQLGKETGAYLSYMYIGTGDVGGAPESLTVDWLQKSIKSDGPMTVASVGADDLPKLVGEFPNAKLQKYDGELVMTRHGVGCYTSQAAMKRWNRRNEQLADAAERAAVTASLLNGYTYPRETLREAWVRFLWHQFHDDLTGTSIPEAYEYSWSDELLSLNQFANIQTDAISAITPALDTRGKGKTVVVYNPLAIDREDVVEVDCPYASATVIDSHGKQIPSQLITDNEGKQKVIFLAKLPPVGYGVFDIRENKSTPDVGPEIAKISVYSKASGKTFLGNERYDVSMNRNGVGGIYDKLANKILLAAPIEWQLIYNKPRQWPAWEIQYEDILSGVNQLVYNDPGEIEVIESGPVRGAIKITRTHNNSTYETIIRLAAGSAGDRIEFINNVDWAEKETLLKAAFKLNGVDDTVTYDLGLGSIKRGINKKEKYEVPGHMWADQTATDNSYGVSILNDCKYGWDHPDNQTLRLTLIHTPGVFDSWNWVGDQSSQDIGNHDFHVCHRRSHRPGAGIRHPMASRTSQPAAPGLRGSAASWQTGQIALASVADAERQADSAGDGQRCQDGRDLR
ncbi:MAG: alpha-mannosidase [bacterium]|nr:alpha-mannosidase [bacterium]